MNENHASGEGACGQLASLARWLWRLVRRVFTRRPLAPIISWTTYPWEKATKIYFAGESLTITGTTYPWEEANKIEFKSNVKDQQRRTKDSE